MYRYRIYTEAKNLIILRETMGEHFPAFTIYHTDGCWERSWEDTIVIEILLQSAEDKSIHDLCFWIKALNKQTSILLTKETVFAECL